MSRDLNEKELVRQRSGKSTLSKGPRAMPGKGLVSLRDSKEARGCEEREAAGAQSQTSVGRRKGEIFFALQLGSRWGF